MTDPLPRVKVVSAPESVPVYNCVIYVERTEKGVQGTIANLADTVVTAPTERDVLQKAVTEFKQLIKKHHDDGSDVPVIDPAEPGQGVIVRYVPVHL